MTNTLTLQIEPLDTLFFKDGKPFSMGDDSWADGVFPPAPSVIYGALRSWILANSPEVNIENVIDETSDLELHDLYYSIGGSNVLPLPNDYGENKEKDKQEQFEEKKGGFINVERFVLKTSKQSTSVQNKLIVYNPNKEYILKAVKNAYISKDNFVQYLKNGQSINKISAKVIENETEPKIGIKRTNQTLAAEEGNLYRVGMNRLPDLKFIVRAKSKYLNPEYEKFIKLGGEGKIVVVDDFLKSRKGAKTINIKTGITTKHLLVYLATPAIFMNKTPDLKKHLGLDAELLASSVGKALNIGGFDMKAGKPKPMYKAVPAGSVYFFELEQEIDVDEFQGRKISDELSQQGFGIAYFGTFKIEE